MSTCNYISLMPVQQCFFDSLNTINNNFAALDTALCQASATVDIKIGTGVAKINAGVHISFDPFGSPGSGAVTLTETIVPPWHVGITGKLLHTESVGNRVSQQLIKSDIIKKHLQDIIEVNPPMVGSEALTFNQFNFTTTPNKFSGGTLLPDGRVFFTPSNSNSARIYDPLTDTCIIPTDTSYSGVPDAYLPGVNLPDGTIYIAPYDTLFARRYDPNTDILTVENTAGTFTTSGGFSKAILLPTGNIFHVPYNNTADLIYNPIAGTTTTTGTLYTGIQAFSDAILMFDGRVFLVPYKSSVAAIYNPGTNTVQNIISKSFINGGGFSGGVLLPDGKIYCVPSLGTQGEIYNPETNLYTTTNGVHPANDSSQGGCLLTDGRVLIFPKNNYPILIFNPQTDTLYNTNIIIGVTNSHSKGVMLQNGDVLFIPKNEAYIARFMYYHQEAFSLSTLTGFFH